MATQRRMFSAEIVKSDAFLDMPPTTQNLYYQLGMEADDDGFIGNPKTVCRVVGSNADDYKILVAKKFIIHFEDGGVCVIKHWRINNQIRKDRYHETKYVEYKERLYIRENGAYSLNGEKGGMRLPKGHFNVKSVENEDSFSGNQMDTTLQPNGNPDKRREEKISKGKTKKPKESTEIESPKVEKEKDRDYIAEVIYEMCKIDPKNKLYYGNKTQRQAIQFLIEAYTFEKVIQMINFVALSKGKIFNIPTTPQQLLDRWVNLLNDQVYKQYSKQSNKKTIDFA